MKTIIHCISFCTIAAFAALNFSGCKDDKAEDPDPVTPDYVAALKGQWELLSVTYNEEEQQGYEDFTLVLGTTSNEDLYSYAISSIRPPLSPWKGDGVWKLGTHPENEIIRDPDTEDELAMNYTASETELVLEFDFTGDGYEGRVSSVSGAWKFIFHKKS